MKTNITILTFLSIVFFYSSCKKESVGVNPDLVTNPPDSTMNIQDTVVDVEASLAGLYDTVLRLIKCDGNTGCDTTYSDVTIEVMKKDSAKIDVDGSGMIRITGINCDYFYDLGFFDPRSSASACFFENDSISFLRSSSSLGAGRVELFTGKKQ